MDYEQEIQRLRAEMDALITRFLPPVVKRLEALEKSEEKRQPVKRKALDYETYRAVLELKNEGYDSSYIAKKLGLPYTTTRTYMRMLPEKVKELQNKRKRERELKECE